jgi:hypothetical protein
MSEARIDTKRLIKSFGGRAMLWRKMRDHGLSVSPRTVDNWADRGNLPLMRFMDLVQIAKKEGREIQLQEYLLNP